MEHELKTIPSALRLLAEQIKAPDHVPAMCLRDAAAMIESLVWQRDNLRAELAKARDLVERWKAISEKEELVVSERDLPFSA